MNSENGMPPPQVIAQGVPTLRVVTREWKGTSTYKALSYSTQRIYGTVEKRLAPIMDLPIDSITQRHLYDCGSELSGLSTMVTIYKALVKNILTYAFARNYIQSIPDIPLKAPKAKKRDAWPAEELRSLIRYPGEDPVKQAMYIAYHTAQRAGDILSLKWDQYDGKSLTFIQQKTKTQVRVPCSRQLKRFLDKLQRNGSYMVQDSGQGLSYAQLYYRFRRDFPKKSFPCFHSIRHTAAGNIAAMGASPSEIKSITGHKSLSSVSRYTQDAEMWKAANKIMGKYK